MKNIIISFVLSLLFFINAIAQQNDFCLSLESLIKIENESDIPSIVENGDGTITLTHPDQSITDLFSEYVIFGLQQWAPSSTNPETLKFYILKHNSRDLIIDIKTTISEDVYSVDGYVNDLPFSDSFLSFIDGKEYSYSGYSTVTDDGGCDNINTCPLGSFPADFNLTARFTYDADLSTLFLETVGPSSCGNEFRIGFKQGANETGEIDEGAIQEWSIDTITTTDTNPDDECYYPELYLYNFLGVGCTSSDDHYGNIYMYYLEGIEKIRFFREHVLFATSIVEFKDPTLNIVENDLDEIIVFQNEGDAFVQIINNLNKEISASVYTASGKLILDKELIRNNQINISHLSIGQLYFVQLETEDNKRKFVKFIKR